MGFDGGEGVKIEAYYPCSAAALAGLSLERRIREAWDRRDGTCPGGTGFVPRPSEIFARLFAYDRAALIAYPIREAEIVYPDVVKPGADCGGCAQRRPPTPFAMGHDVIA